VTSRGAWLLSVAATVLVLSVAACGGDDAESGTTAGGGQTAADKTDPNKPVVKLGLITAVGNPVSTHPSTVSAARAAITGVNARGGFNGHKVELVFCNDKVDPNQTATCARQMVAEKVAAIAGGQSVFDANSQPILERAGIPMVGINPIATQVTNADNVYLPNAPTVVSYEALAAYASRKNLAPVGLAVADNPGGRSLAGIAENALKQASGGTGFVKTAPVAGDTADFAPIASALDDAKPKTALLLISITLAKGLTRALDAQGSEISTFYMSPAHSLDDIKSMGPSGEKIMTAQSFPPLTHPSMKRFVDELKAEEEAGDKDAALDVQDSFSLEAWVAVQALEKVVADLDTIDAKSITAALDGAKDIEVGDFMSPWTPSAKGPKGFSRISNQSVWFVGYQGGKPVTLTDEPVLLQDVIAGNFEARMPPSVEGQ
jgi:ABC-type branched-subunit amino acid transport system substrate-binding protein